MSLRKAWAITLDPGLTGPLLWHFSSSVCVLPGSLRDLVIYSRKASHGLADEEPYQRSGVKDLHTHNQWLMLRKCFAMNTEKGRFTCEQPYRSRANLWSEVNLCIGIWNDWKAVKVLSWKWADQGYKQKPTGISRKNTELEIIKLELPGPTFIPESLKDIAIGVSPF